MSQSPLPKRFSVYSALTRLFGWLNILVILVMVLFITIIEQSGDPKRIQIMLGAALGVPIFSTLIMLVFYFLWQRTATTVSAQLLPDEKAALLHMSGKWWQRRMHSFAQMRALWTVWRASPPLPWYKNPAAYWQIMFVVWLISTKNLVRITEDSSGKSNVLANLSLLQNAVYAELALLAALTMLNVYLCKTISRAIRAYSLAKPRTHDEFGQPLHSPQPVHAQALPTPNTPQRQEQTQDPVLWRRPR